MHCRLWQVDTLRKAFMPSEQLIFVPEICKWFIFFYFSLFTCILRTCHVTWQNTASILNGTEQVGLAVTLEAYMQETPVYILSRLIGQTEVCSNQSLHAIAEIIPWLGHNRFLPPKKSLVHNSLVILLMDAS